MTDQHRSGHTEYKGEQNLWDALREIHRARGIDLGQLLFEWAAEQVQTLPSREGKLAASMIPAARFRWFAGRKLNSTLLA
jgi:predicted DNA-binding ribbon-helix-helix protein